MASEALRTYRVRLRRPWPGREGRAGQKEFVECTKKRIIIRAGRRGGKTSGIAIRHVQRFLAGRRQLYAAPTEDQVSRFWTEITRALADPIEAGVLYKNETKHIVELPGTEQRIRAKTAWNADSLRGDYADDLTLDEWQLMDETAWTEVGAPMLLDNNGDAVFIYTPPSLHSRGASKASDPRHAPKMFQKALTDPRWATFHFSSRDNPHVSAEAIAELAQDMTALAYRQEIEAEDVDEAPGALWKRATLDAGRLTRHPDLARVVVGVDPPGGSTECGIVAAGVGECMCKGKAELHGFVVEDASLAAPPDKWASAAVTVYHGRRADRVLGEQNFGGDMVESTIRTADAAVSYRSVHASRGKQVRAEPAAALYEQGKVHHVGRFQELEDEMCGWDPASSRKSPNRMDALVWAITDLMLKTRGLVW